MSYYQRAPRSDGRSGDFHSEVAEKLDVCVSIRLYVSATESLAPVKHMSVKSQNERAIELRERLYAFKDRLRKDLIIEMRVVQAKAADKKKLDDLVYPLAENRPSPRDPCMEGTRNDILDKIESELKRIDGPNVIWIRGSPGVGKSTLAASVSIRLQKQNRQVIWFRFDRTESSTITTDALWRFVAHDLAHLYPSVCRLIPNDNQMPILSDIDQLFKSLIETPLSTLGDVPHEELPVIVIDGLDECGGHRYDSSGQRDYEALLRTLKHWVEVDHLKKFKLVITSRPEDCITETFPDSISTHVNIPSGTGVKPGDSASDDIRVFLTSKLNAMGMGEVWVKDALDYLVPRAAGMFIWATTVADFLELDPEVLFDVLEASRRKDGMEGLDDLYSLYSTVVKTSFGGGLEDERIKGVISVMGAMIFSKQPLNDDALIMLPGVESQDMLQLIREGLASVIESGPMLRFHHRSFEDFLLSPLFQRELPKFSTVQDRNLHERQLAVLCLNTMASSELHFNMCGLGSSCTRNVDIPLTVKSTIPFQVSYSCQFWADHLVHTPPEDQFMEAVKFVMYEKLLFWMEVMSVLGKAHEIFGILTQALAWPGLTVCLQIVYCNTCLMVGGQTLDPGDELTSFIGDALRFISAFIVPISESAPHIYLSALPFSPERSLVADKFCSRFPNTPKVIESKPVQSPMAIFTAEHHKGSVRSIVFSPDGKIFASTSTSIAHGIAITYVCDSETGHRISGPFKSKDLYSYQADACLSPDGKHVLVQYLGCTVVWDIERGKKQLEFKACNSAFVCHGRYHGRITSTHWDWVDGRICVKLWDAGKGVLISDKLFEVYDAGITRLSPDGRLLAIGRRSENAIALWNVEDGKDVQRFPYPPGYLSSLHFSPTSDFLVATFDSPDHICLWRLYAPEMAPINLEIGHISSACIHLPMLTSTDFLFILRSRTVEIWEVSSTGSNMVFEIQSPMTSEISCICPSRDGRRLLVGSYDGSVMMWRLNAEDMAGDRSVTANTQDDTDMLRVISFSHSGKMAATKSRSAHVEFRDTTGEAVWRTNIEYKNDMNIAFSPDDNQVAFLSDSLITICDIMHPEKNRVSFKPWPRGRRCFIGKVAFQTCNDLVICAELCGSVSDGILQVWRLTDLECTFSLDLKIPSYSEICLAPDGLTVVIISRNTVSCYSWNHDTAQFDLLHFTDEEHLVGHGHVYSPDGQLLACRSHRENSIRVWDTRTGRLCDIIIIMPEDVEASECVEAIALSPALNDQSFGDRIIALSISKAHPISVYDIHTTHLRAQFHIPENAIRYPRMSFIQDGTKLALYSLHDGRMRIWDPRAEYSHVTHRHELFPQNMEDGWMTGRGNALLFWVPSEHRESLWVSLPRMVVGVPREKVMGLDLSGSRLGSEWTECIDKGWLKMLEEKEGTRKLLE